MKKHTYYDLLKVSRDADIITIKKSWKQLMLQWHPDKNKNSKEAEEMSKDINAAYEVLSDEAKRKIYDAKILREERSEQERTQRTYTSTKSAGTPPVNWGVFILLLLIGAVLIGIANSGNNKNEE